MRAVAETATAGRLSRNLDQFCEAPIVWAPTVETDCRHRRFSPMPELPARGCRIDSEPKECVVDDGALDLCLYAAELTRPHQCPWWREEENPAPTRARRKRQGHSAGGKRP